MLEIEYSDDYIRKYKDKIDWDEISENENIREDFIIKFQDKLNWELISKHQNLRESFIRTYKNNCYWPIISIYQNLSETFIKDFAYSVCWPMIFQYQILSEKFIRESIIKYNILYTEYIYKLGNLCTRRTTSKTSHPNFKIFNNLKKNKNIKYFSTIFIFEYPTQLKEYYIYNYAANKIREYWLKYMYKPGNVGYTKTMVDIGNIFN